MFTDDEELRLRHRMQPGRQEAMQDICFLSIRGQSRTAIVEDKVRHTNGNSILRQLGCQNSLHYLHIESWLPCISFHRDGDVG